MKLDLPTKPASSYNTRGARSYAQKKGFSLVEPTPILEQTSEVNGGIGITMARNEPPPKQATVTNCASILDPLLLGQRAVETHLVTNSLKSTGTDQTPESPIWRRRCNGISYPETHVILCRFLNQSLSGVAETLEAIDGRLQWQLDYEHIQQEWGQLARVVERLLMIAFIIGTIMFAALVTVLAVPMPMVTFWG